MSTRRRKTTVIKWSRYFVLILFGLTLTACSRGPDSQHGSISGEELVAPLPDLVATLALDESNLIIDVLVNGVKKRAEVLSVDSIDKTFTARIASIPEGTRTPSLVYSVNDPTYRIVELAAKLGKALLQTLEKNPMAKSILENQKIDSQKLILALDTLYEAQTIDQKMLFDPTKIPQLRHLQKEILQEGLEDLERMNIHAVALYNEFLRFYSGGYGYNELLPDEEIEASLHLDGALTDFQGRMETVFLEALKGAQYNPETLQEQLKPALQAMTILPFGEDGRGDAFEAAILDFLNQAQEAFQTLTQQERQNPQVLRPIAELFSRSFLKHMDTINLDHGGQRFNQGKEEPHIDPRIQKFNIQGGAGRNSTRDIIQAYNARNDGHPVFRQDPLFFKDQSGQLFVAFLDRKSNIFTIQEFPLKDMQKQMKALPPDKPADGNWAAWRRERVAFMTDFNEKYPIHALLRENYVFSSDTQVVLDMASKAQLFAAELVAIEQKRSYDRTTSAHDSPREVVKLDQGALSAAVPYKGMKERAGDSPARTPEAFKKRLALHQEDRLDKIKLRHMPRLEIEEGRALIHYANLRTGNYETLDITQELAHYMRHKPKPLNIQKTIHDAESFHNALLTSQKTIIQHYPAFTAIAQFHKNYRGVNVPLMIEELIEQSGVKLEQLEQ